MMNLLVQLRKGLPGLVCLALLFSTGGRDPEMRHLVFAGAFLLAAVVFLSATVRPASFVRTSFRLPFTFGALPLWGYLVWHYTTVSQVPVLAVENGLALLAFTVFADLCWLVRPGQKPGRNHVGFLVVIMSLVALAGIATHLKGELFPTFSPRVLLMPDRATGPFDNANHFACWLNIGALAALALLVSNKTKGEVRALLVVELIVLCAAIMLTFSRSAQAAIAVGLIILGGIHSLRGANKRNRILSALLTVLVTGALIAFALLSPTMSDRWQSAEKNMRSGIWDNALTLIETAPLHGQGAGSYAYSARPSSNFWFTDTVINHAHNEALNVIAEIGWAGLGVTLLGVIPLVLLTSFSSRKPDAPRPDTYRLLPAVLWVVLGLQAVVDLNLRIPVIAFTAIYVMSLLARQRPGPRQSIQPSRTFRTSVLLLAIVSLIASAGSFRVWQSYTALQRGESAASRFDLWTAKAAFEHAQQINPIDWRPNRSLAQWHLRFGRMQSGTPQVETLNTALDYAEISIEQNRFDPQTVIAKARILQVQGELPAAQVLLEEHRKVDGRNFTINRELGEIYIAQENWERAYWILGKFTERESGYAEARERYLFARDQLRASRTQKD